MKQLNHSLRVAKIRKVRRTHSRRGRRDWLTGATRLEGRPGQLLETLPTYGIPIVILAMAFAGLMQTAGCDSAAVELNDVRTPVSVR